MVLILTICCEWPRSGHLQYLHCPPGVRLQSKTCERWCWGRDWQSRLLLSPSPCSWSTSEPGPEGPPSVATWAESSTTTMTQQQHKPDALFSIGLFLRRQLIYWPVPSRHDDSVLCGEGVRGQALDVPVPHRRRPWQEVGKSETWFDRNLQVQHL